MRQSKHSGPQPRGVEGAGLEERLARLEGRVEELSKRVDDLRSSMNHGFSELSKRVGRLKDRLESRFKWIMGTLITMWSTIIVTLIATL